MQRAFGLLTVAITIAALVALSAAAAAPWMWG